MEEVWEGDLSVGSRNGELRRGGPEGWGQCWGERCK